MNLPRALLLVLVLAVLTTAATLVVAVSGEDPDAPVPRLAAARADLSDDAAAGAGREDPAVRVLHAWDVRRARAWAAGDARALRRLYVRGSRAGRADVAMLHAWLARGLRVRGMRMQVVAATVRGRGEARVVLEVTDRLVGATTVAAGRRVPLPRDVPSRHTVVLVRVAGQWLVRAVRG